MPFPPEDLKISSQELSAPELESEELRIRETSTEDLTRRQKAKIDSRKVEIFKLRSSRKRYERRYRGAKKEVAGLEHEFGKVFRAHEEALEKREKRVRAMEDELARTKELLAARSTELSAMQSFLSTADRITEEEVLSIVRDLNKQVRRVATNLTREWEKLGPPSSGKFFITKKEFEEFSQFYGPVLVNQSLKGDPATVKFLVQSCFCFVATQITSSWRHYHGVELGVLGSVYKHLTTSEEQPISAIWRSLTHNHLIDPSPNDSTSFTQHVANALWITGSFPSVEDSIGFVKAKASDGIDTIDRLARRLESAFMVDILSCDMCLLIESPCTTFDEKWMTKEVESYESSRRRDKVAGTTGVGVWKSVGARQSGGQRTKVLLKTRVILERDVTDLENTTSCILV